MLYSASMHALYIGLLLAYGFAITARLGVSAFGGEGHTWSMWDGGLLMRGKSMSPTTTWAAFALAAVCELVATVMLGPRLLG